MGCSSSAEADPAVASSPSASVAAPVADAARTTPNVAALPNPLDFAALLPTDGVTPSPPLRGFEATPRAMSRLVSPPPLSIDADDDGRTMASAAAASTPGYPDDDLCDGTDIAHLLIADAWTPSSTSDAPPHARRGLQQRARVLASSSSLDDYHGMMQQLGVMTAAEVREAELELLSRSLYTPQTPFTSSGRSRRSLVAFTVEDELHRGPSLGGGSDTFSLSGRTDEHAGGVAAFTAHVAQARSSSLLSASSLEPLGSMPLASASPTDATPPALPPPPGPSSDSSLAADAAALQRQRRRVVVSAP